LSVGSLVADASIKNALAVETHQNRADVIFLQIENHSHDVIGKGKKLAGHGIFQAIDPRDAVSHRNHPASFLKLDPRIKSFDLFLDQGTDFIRSQIHLKPPLFLWTVSAEPKHF